MLLTGDGTPMVLLDITWERHTCTLWHLDAQLRRAAKYELRRLTGPELVLVEQVRWRYPDDQRPEFDALTPRHTRRYSAEGLVHEIDEPFGDRGGGSHRFGRIRCGPPRHPVPPFGLPASWARLAAMLARPAAVVGLAGGGPEPAAPLLGGLPWQPPVPSRPALLEPMFTDGTRYELPGRGVVAVEVHHAGWLRMPTGRLVAADAAALAGGVPFTVRVAPGRYPVTLSVLHSGDQPGRPTLAAGRLRVADGPVVTWELALRPGPDPGALGRWESFGFEVTTGTACLLDAAGRGALAGDVRLTEVAAGRAVCTDDASGPNLIAFPASLGSYPTWIGRTTTGEVACFVADLMRLPEATELADLGERCGT
jgi:hypothetical protein